MKANIIRAPARLRMYPLAAGVAVSVIVLGLVGIGAFTGWIPSSLTQRRADSAATAPAAPAALERAVRCPACGVIESIYTVELRGTASGPGAFPGGVTGPQPGNTMGRSDGNTAMANIGAAGGVAAGNEIERNVKRRFAYRVTVRMDDGSVRTVSHASPPAFAVGDKVRVVNGAVVDA